MNATPGRHARGQKRQRPISELELSVYSITTFIRDLELELELESFIDLELELET